MLEQPEHLTFIMSDYPVGAEEQYQIDVGLVDLPSDVGTGRGLQYYAFNYSDDIDSNLIWSLDASAGLAPSTTYTITSTFSFYSNAPIGCAGVGGGPDGVWPALCASADPDADVRIVDNLNHWRLPLGSREGNCGLAGDIGTAGTDCFNANPWSLETRTSDPIEIETAADGSLLISLSTHSGFESDSRFYYRNVEITLTPKP